MIIVTPTRNIYGPKDVWVFRSKEVVTLWFYDSEKFVQDWRDDGLRWSNRKYVDWLTVEEVS